MKTTYWTALLLCLLIISCGRKDRWNVKLAQEKTELKFTDISADFFNREIPLMTLKNKYPFLFDDHTANPTPDEVWEKQRRDTLENGIYDSVKKVYAKADYKDELGKLFAYYKYYFPKEMTPQIYTYSSGMQSIYNPVIYGRKEGMLFIALDGFLGSKSQWYKRERVYPYMAKNMAPLHLAPAVVQAIGLEIVPFNPRQQTFIDLMVDEGKKLILADALLPSISDELKIGYTKEELEWAKANEGNVWNYFVEQNMVFDSDKSLRERFLQPAPFSKFLNEIEADSPGRIGVWTGWQICRKYLDENPEMTLEQFINQDTQAIFKGSKYKPKRGNEDYKPVKEKSKDEVSQYENYKSK